MKMRGKESLFKMLIMSGMMMTTFLSNTYAYGIEKPKWFNSKNVYYKHSIQFLEYSGKYDMGEGITFTLTQKDQSLMGELSGVGTIEIFPEEGIADTFYAKMAPAKFVFQRDKVSSLTITIEAKGTLRGQKVQ